MMKVNLDLKREIQTLEDHDCLILHYSGGLAARHLTKGWTLEPVPIDGKPHIIGFFSESEIRAVIENLAVEPLFFEQQGFRNGVQHRFYRPWSPTAHKKEQSASDLWSSIAGNIGPDEEREKDLASRVALGIRSVEVHMGRIASSYSGQLIGAITSKKKSGHRFSMGVSHEISASIHDFYTSVGSLRDHLAALIAARNGKAERVDDLTRLMGAFKGERAFHDKMMGVFFSGSNLTIRDGKLVQIGILNEIGLVRKRMVHGKPHGSHEDERWGRVIDAIGGENLPMLLYEHCLAGDDGQKYELLKYVRRHYMFMMRLLEEMAYASEYTKDMLRFDDSNTLSIKIDK